MQTIYISINEFQALSKLVTELIRTSPKTLPAIQKLHEELNRAVVLDPKAIPNDIVTLNSRVSLRDLDTGELEDWILTMPEHADSDEKRISVLAPIGTAVLGFPEGCDIEWDTPGGFRKLRIEKVEHNAFVPARMLEFQYH